MDKQALEQARLRIYALQDGAVRAQALAFCLATGFFDRLESAPRTFEAISRDLDLSPRVLPALLAFLSSEGLVERRGDGAFANSAAASAFLVRASPRYAGGRGLLFRGFYDAIAHLPETLATGLPWMPEGQHDMFAGFSEEDQRWFAEGMFANAVAGGSALVRTVDFGSVRRLLDVGGNAGGYAIALCNANPALAVTILDLEATRPLAEERIRAAGLEGRVAFTAGSLFEPPLPPGHDAVLLSSILHDWDDADCGRILAACFEALPPGGLIVVTEPMLAEDHTGPGHPAASGLTMALLGGENRTRTGVAAMLEAVGFAETGMSDLGEQNSVVTAKRPESAGSGRP
jgi:SAM-dependent methyltransferase